VSESVKWPNTVGYLRVRLGLHDTHYADGLIPPATVLRLFADCSSELGIQSDGTDGYLAAYERAEFLCPLFAGDYIAIKARTVSKGIRSRRTALEAYRCLKSIDLGAGLTGGHFSDPPELVAHAVAIAVRPRETITPEIPCRTIARLPSWHALSAPDAILRDKLEPEDTHYRGDLIPAATIMRLFADCEARVCVRDHGRPGFVAAYKESQFLRPLRVGDHVEVRANLVECRNSERITGLQVWRLHPVESQIIEAYPNRPAIAPELVAHTILVTRIPS
jgi:3-aminobutyryl-CoA ammonia-lyase